MDDHSPLREILVKKEERPRKRFNDSPVFIAILATFVLGMLVFGNNQGITGRIIYQEESEVINLSMQLSESQNLSLDFKGNITSLRITGILYVNSSAIIYLGDKLVFDSSISDKEQSNLITGMEISQVSEDELANSTLDAENSGETQQDQVPIGLTRHCEETCLINMPQASEIIVILDDAWINITGIEYSYLREVAENIANISNVTINSSIDAAVENENATSATVLENVSDAAIQNISINNTLLNITENSTDAVIVNMNEIQDNPGNISRANDSAIDISIPIVFTELDLFNMSLGEKGIALLYHDENSGEYRIGKDADNYITIKGEDLREVNIEIKESVDARLKSDVFVLENLTNPATVNIGSTGADTIVRCIQYTNGTCRRWEKSGIDPIIAGGDLSFVAEQGIYAAAEIFPVKKDYIPTGSVYYNSDCEYCEKTYNCEAEKFCPMQNAIYKKVTFTTQLDFDILSLDPSWVTAEVCAYSYYNSGVPVMNYLKDSPESFCSDIRNGNSASDLISLKLMPGTIGWNCIDATEIIRDAQTRYYSNVFINWLGEDLQESNFPYNCYYGKASIDNCIENPSGADDCRPYLRLEYR